MTVFLQEMFSSPSLGTEVGYWKVQSAKLPRKLCIRVLSERDDVWTKIPFGFSLLLVGSGIYWILSGQLIGSFTVLEPGIFSSSDVGVDLILAVGVVSSAAGFWIIDRDLNFASKLLNETEGWVYLIPIFLVAGDLSLTITGLSSSRSVIELNPLVSMVLQQGSSALVPFVISYMALSEGLAFLMLYLGNRLFPTRPARFIPFAAICGAASFGMGSNIALLVVPSFSQPAFTGGAAAALLIAAFVFVFLKNSRLTPPVLPRINVELSKERQHLQELFFT